MKSPADNDVLVSAESFDLDLAESMPSRDHQVHKPWRLLILIN